MNKNAKSPTPKVQGPRPPGGDGTPDRIVRRPKELDSNLDVRLPSNDRKGRMGRVGQVGDPLHFSF